MADLINVTVPSEAKIYEIYLTDSFVRLADQIQATGLDPDKIALIADTNTAPLYADACEAALAGKWESITRIVLPSGEINKTLETVTTIYDRLAEERFTRKSLLIALGGGVICDLTGFAAATYMRGIPFAQVPTTLLSQVDASIGGKTGFDYKGYKNMIGAFHMPSVVYINTSVLKTLPEREIRSGLAEVIKAALIKDAAFYEWLKENRRDILELEPKALSRMIGTAVRIKQAVVESDPYEKGERMLLNFGHTIGHAVEKARGFSLTHGECVAIGMAAADRISVALDLMSERTAEEILETLKAFGLPVTFDGASAEDVLDNTKSDKKRRSGAIRFVLLDEIGHAVISKDVTDALMEAAIKTVLTDTEGPLNEL